jgi:nitroimidazol reductase NimA-like FMN-containing flavoprotein (pyridoxamine 5'-phosphate oxidase superfamily)
MVASIMAIENDKKAQIEEALREVVLARLATANSKTCQPHVVPVWFLWDGESIWISAFNSTRKVKDLQGNRKCSILVEPVQGKGKLQAVLLEGQSELISEPRKAVEEISLRIYSRYLGTDGVLEDDPQSWSKDPENTIIKLTPSRIFTW